MKSSHIWRSDIPDENISLSGRGVFVDVQGICQRVVAVPRAKGGGKVFQLSVARLLVGEEMLALERLVWVAGQG